MQLQDNLYDIHPDLKDFDSFCKKYCVRNLQNKIVECWEREDVDKPWKNVTGIEQLKEQIAEQEAELSKLRIKNSIMPTKMS